MLITLLNIRSIGRCMNDFLLDIHVSKASIVCCTETQMTENMVMSPHADLLQRQDFISNNNIDKFKVLLLYSRTLSECEDSDNFAGFIYANFTSTHGGIKTCRFFIYSKRTIRFQGFFLT